MSITYPEYRGLRLEEDVALRQLLSGITLPDARGNAIPVPVRFREPDREQAPADPPYIIIDQLDTEIDHTREHRGWNIMYGDEPYTNNLAPGYGYVGSWPIPVQLNYQITTVTRVNQHDVILNDILVTTQLPFRFGNLICPSGTVRCLNVLSGPHDASRLVDNRREFRKVWTIQVSAEIITGLREIAPLTEVIMTVGEIGEAPDTTITTEL